MPTRRTWRIQWRCWRTWVVMLGLLIACDDVSVAHARKPASPWARASFSSLHPLDPGQSTVCSLQEAAVVASKLTELAYDPERIKAAQVRGRSFRIYDQTGSSSSSSSEIHTPKALIARATVVADSGRDRGGVFDLDYKIPWAFYEVTLASSGAQIHVLAFRGTDPFNVRDWRVNGHIKWKPLLGMPAVRIHGGWYTTALHVFRRVKRWLFATQKHASLTGESRELWLAGHSLGGAVAKAFQLHLLALARYRAMARDYPKKFRKHHTKYVNCDDDYAARKNCTYHGHGFDATDMNFLLPAMVLDPNHAPVNPDDIRTFAFGAPPVLFGHNLVSQQDLAKLRCHGEWRFRDDGCKAVHGGLGVTARRVYSFIKHDDVVPQFFGGICADIAYWLENMPGRKWSIAVWRNLRKRWRGAGTKDNMGKHLAAVRPDGKVVDGADTAKASTQARLWSYFKECAEFSHDDVHARVFWLESGRSAQQGLLRELKQRGLKAVIKNLRAMVQLLIGHWTNLRLGLQTMLKEHGAARYSELLGTVHSTARLGAGGVADDVEHSDVGQQQFDVAMAKAFADV